MKRLFIFCLLSGALLASGNEAASQNPVASVNNVETDGDNLKVKGLDGWMPGRNISFGDYYAKKIKRSATKGGGGLFFPSINKNMDAHKTTKFTQRAPDGSSAKVSLIEEVKRKGYGIGGEDVEFEHVSEYVHTVKGTIIPSVNSGNTWAFTWNIADPNAAIMVSDKKGQQMEVSNMQFKLDSSIVGGYSWSYVWIKDDLSVEHKLVVSSLITSIIGREGIQLEADENDDW